MSGSRLHRRLRARCERVCVVVFVAMCHAHVRRYATAALAEWAVVTYGPGAAEFNAIYMIGDNPSGDIRGANLAGMLRV